VDLAYPEVRLEIEYDGVVLHTDARALAVTGSGCMR